MTTTSFHRVSAVVLTLAALLMAPSCKQAGYGVVRPVSDDAVAPNKDEQIKTTNEGVTFGTTGVFHLGNAKYAGTSCKTRISALPLNGRTFNFTFTVTAENTPVQINVTDLCGIDLDNNTVSLVSTSVIQAPIPIMVGATSMALPPIVLNAGTYTVKISSGKNTSDKRYTIGDYDDFIVGHVQVQGQNIVGVGFDAEP